MAATMHAKMNRKKLSKLNIIQICEEILNPSVPMALRLSGILMGGVVIVYERKVKLLYDDVTRLLVEINEAWKMKSAPDSTLLPKWKSQAKREAVTLLDNQETDVGDIEQSLNFANATTVEFQHTAYISMRLDNIDEPYINDNPREEDLFQHFHQAVADNITLLDRFDSYQAGSNNYNLYERFDIEGDDETQLNFTSVEHTHIPTTLLPSPPPQDEPQGGNEYQDQHPEYQVKQSDEHKEARQDQQRQEPKKRKTSRAAASVMDYEQTIIPGHVYQSWLHDASDVISRGRRNKKARLNIMGTMKIANLLELPSVALIDDFNYPEPLLELWMKYSQLPHDSPSARIIPPPPQPAESASSTPPERVVPHDPMDFPFEDFQSRVGSQSLGVSIEKVRGNDVENDLSMEILMGELRTNLVNNGLRVSEANPLVTPGNSGDGIRSIPSSASGNGILSHNLEVNSGRSNKKRPHSSSKHSGSALEPVAEEKTWHYPDPNFKLSRLSENGLTPDQELLVETGPTQTQHPLISHPIDRITDSIRVQMKTHFDTPGAPEKESLDNLAFGMNRKGAAMLFYQTCVLASHNFLRVEQMVPYGDILISKGAKM
ncbi:Rad21_Rec8 domain-containing protein/Rad21_Rec8_N domain-containing protein [Cephalotus follicularis]|uniref:Rad21_Rec8 domain-containing protein/Rad21_Rec8_N domain-containing protein n=1 Tax=Cephalotus follicularis TaxID=3775 RepID=A0A1Q3D6L7_CEPFO|nr:Rad21_Rec8 domain-containing protein/Rad21_Rec8_N domain-containing protein [Cephalotus follicularis]